MLFWPVFVPSFALSAGKTRLLPGRKSGFCRKNAKKRDRWVGSPPLSGRLASRACAGARVRAFPPRRLWRPTACARSCVPRSALSALPSARRPKAVAPPARILGVLRRQTVVYLWRLWPLVCALCSPPLPGGSCAAWWPPARHRLGGLRKLSASQPARATRACGRQCITRLSAVKGLDRCAALRALDGHPRAGSDAAKTRYAVPMRGQKNNAHRGEGVAHSRVKKPPTQKEGRTNRRSIAPAKPRETMPRAHAIACNARAKIQTPYLSASADRM